MIVYDAFVGDDNKALKLVQHDLWFRTNDLWIDSDGLAMSSCFYMFSLARKSFMFNTGENPLFFPEREQIPTIDSFDQRVLQGAHQLIADTYRWCQHKVIAPPFQQNAQDYRAYLRDNWITYLKHEFAQWVSNIAVAEMIVRAVVFQNSTKGYEAEDLLKQFLEKRYAAYLAHMKSAGKTTASKDQALLDDFTRIRIEPDAIVLEIQTLAWDGHTPETHWEEVKRLPPTTKESEITKQHKQLLQRRRFFRVCTVCNERQPNGCMHDDEICQSCAEKTLGVVY